MDHVKSDLMPDYDYDEYTRRHEEYELNKEQEQQGDNGDTAVVNEPVVNEPVAKEEDTVSSLDKIEDDLAW